MSEPPHPFIYFTELLHCFQERFKLPYINPKGSKVIKKPSQVRLLSAIFDDYCKNSCEISEFPSSTASALFNADRDKAQKVLEYYEESGNPVERLERNILRISNAAEGNDLPSMISNLPAEIRNSIASDAQLGPMLAEWNQHSSNASASSQKERNLSSAKILAKMLYCSLRALVNPDDSAFPSPVASDHADSGSSFCSPPPAPCDPFYGREKELVEIYDALQNRKHLFLQGLPGFGKSELTKKFAQRYQEKYETIIFFYYSGKLEDDICNLSFFASCHSPQALVSAYKPSDTDQVLRQTLQQLKSLPENSLLIIDNFDASPRLEPLLLQLLDLNCHILITTRYDFTQDSLTSPVDCMQIGPLSKEELTDLFTGIVPEYHVKRSAVSSIIKAVYYNTLIVKLSALHIRELKIDPDALASDFRNANKKFPDLGRVGVQIDTAYYEESFLEHIKIIFKTSDLGNHPTEILRYLSLMPSKNISPASFCKWTKCPQDTLSLLKKMGYLIDSTNQSYAMHDLVQKVILSVLPPNLDNCVCLLDALRKECGSVLRRVFLPQKLTRKQVQETKYFLRCIVSVTDHIEPQGLPENHDTYIHMIESSLPFFQIHLPNQWRPMLEKLKLHITETHTATRAQRSILYLNLFAAAPKGPESEMAKQDILLNLSFWKECIGPFSILETALSILFRTGSLEQVLMFLQESLAKQQEDNWLILGALPAFRQMSMDRQKGKKAKALNGKSENQKYGCLDAPPSTSP